MKLIKILLLSASLITASCEYEEKGKDDDFAVLSKAMPAEETATSYDEQADALTAELDSVLETAPNPLDYEFFEDKSTSDINPYFDGISENENNARYYIAQCRTQLNPIECDTARTYIKEVRNLVVELRSLN